jgi:Ca-activated chloride channel homolog
MSTEKYPFPQWQLTAYVLNELEPEVAAQIQSAADGDPSLASEIAAIRATIAQVTQLYKHETSGIEPTEFAPATSHSTVDTRTAAENPLVFAHKGYLKMNRTAVVGLLAAAASLLIAVVLAAPALKDYFAQPTADVLARAEQTQSSASPKSESVELGQPNADNSEFPDLQSVPSLPVVAAQTGTKELDPILSKRLSIGSRVATIEESAEAEFVSDPTALESTQNPSNESFAGGTGGGGRDGGMPADAKADGAQAAIHHPFGAVVDEPQGMGAMGGGRPTGEDREMGRTDNLDVELNQGSVASAVPAFGNFEAAPSASLPLGDELASEASPGGRAAARAVGDLPNYLQDDVKYFPESKEKKLAEESRFRDKRPRYPIEQGGDRYAPIYENPFKFVESDPLTTFSIDVDTASYVKARQFLLQSQSLPPVNAVRVEEFVNYFEYEYAGPQGDDPFAANLAVATCPWRTDHKLVRIALQAKKMAVSERPKANIVFLLDVSGSMDEPNKLPLVKESMRMLIQQLGENDRVAMVVYAGAAGCVLESTTGDRQDVILGALDRLNAGGSTNGGQGIQLAYDIARDHFVPGGVNRVILCTDGDFNVGTTSTEGLVNLVVENAKSKVFLTVLGFGMGNTNDTMMEQISNKGNGVYGFVDSRREAQRQMIKQLAGNLMTVAKDVKIQVEFNPERVASYRLIGYENRKLANEDFANDKKDAGEIGAGHRVTALYEIEPIGAARVQPAEGLRYQKRKAEVAAEPEDNADVESSHELLAVSLRYKQPEGDTSKLLTFPLIDSNKPFGEADQDFKWAASVAQFAMLLRNSTHKGSTSWSGLLETVESLATDESRRECVNMIRIAAGLRGSYPDPQR